jgi:putative aminopeptidase FrvX
MHTPNEVLNIDDAKATSDGIRKFITSQESAGEALC